MQHQLSFSYAMLLCAPKDPKNVSILGCVSLEFADAREILMQAH